MKHNLLTFWIAFVYCLLSLFPAEAKTILPIQTESSIDSVACHVYRATIDNYKEEDNSLTISIYDIESFPVEEVTSLIPGDKIITTEKWTQKKICILIQTIDFFEDDCICEINCHPFDTGEPLKLRQNSYGKVFQPETYGVPIWTRIGTRCFNLSNQFLFLDGTTITTHDPQDIPSVYTTEDFFFLIKNERENKDVGFDIYNTLVIFNELEEVALIYRFFVGWQ